MFLDQTLKLSDEQAITVTAPSTTIYDVTGAGSGNAPSMVFGTAGIAKFDIGAGDGVRPTAYFSVAEAFTAAGAATLTIAIEAAPDNGSNAPGTYTVIAQTGPLAVADLVAGANLSIPVPTVSIGQELPRFYRFNYTVATGPFTAGTLIGCIIQTPAMQTNIQYGNNFTAV